MKLVRNIFKITLVLTGVLLITIISILRIDTNRTGYLKIENNDLASTDSYLITHVNIVPMNHDTVLVDKVVYIKDGMIQSITDDIEISGVEIVDAKEQYLIPGLIDMHVHIWDRYELGLYLSNGITAVRNLWGMPMHLKIKEEVNNNEIISPLFFTTGPKLTGQDFIGNDNLHLANPNEAKEKVISYKNRGYDFIKTYNGLTKDIFDAIVEQSIVSDMDIIAHPSQRVLYAYHFKPPIKSIEHAEEIIQQPLNYSLDTFKLKEVITTIAKSGPSSFCPTLTGYYNIYELLKNDEILTSGQMELMNPLIRKTDSRAQFNRWHNAKMKDSAIASSIKNQHDFHLKIIKDLHEAGTTIICGTDSGIGITIPGYSIHQELSFYKEAGLSNYEVLKTATISASRTHSMMNQMGSIEVGKVANLLLVKSNPLLDLAVLQRPSIVFVKGKKLNRETLDYFEEKARERKNLLASALRYLENLIIEKNRLSIWKQV